MFSESPRISTRVDSEMAELQRGGVGDGPHSSFRERRSPVPVQRAGGDRVYAWRSRARLNARENANCMSLY